LKFNNQPKNIFLPRFDSLGDLILFTSYLQSLKKVLPYAKLSVGVRKPFQDYQSILHGIVDVMVVDLPYLGEYDKKELDNFLSKIKEKQFDSIHFTTHNATWIELEILNNIKDIYSITISPKLKNYKNMNYVEVEEREHEVEKYKKLFTNLFPNESSNWTKPSISFIPSLAETKKKSLNKKFNPNEYITWNPGGIFNFSAKNWPIENHYRLILEFLENFPEKIVLIGIEKEREFLEKLKSDIPQNLDKRIHVYIGKENELTELSILILNSKFYIGNDTGTTHLAAVLQIPVFSIFGGGTWPRFIPFTNQKMILMNQLPCFGCNWGCYLGKTVCIQGITFDNVRDLFRNFVRNYNSIDEIINLNLNLNEILIQRLRELSHENYQIKMQIQSVSRDFSFVKIIKNYLLFLINKIIKK
jgi:ADP-heptose:LPS heptosyltransferase